MTEGDIRIAELRIECLKLVCRVGMPTTASIAEARVLEAYIFEAQPREPAQEAQKRARGWPKGKPRKSKTSDNP